MTLRAPSGSLLLVGEWEERRVWRYRCSAHILDVMIRDGYFSGQADKLALGDVILVDCPGYYDLRSVLGSAPQPIHRLGGGVLQVAEKPWPDRALLRIAGRGLLRFLKTGESAMPSPSGAQQAPAPRNGRTPGPAEQGGAAEA